MEKNERAIEVLNDLIRINNDRIEGYEKAIDKANETDVDLRAIFNRMAQESRKYANDLTTHVRGLGGDPGIGNHCLRKNISCMDGCKIRFKQFRAEICFGRM